MGNNKSWLALIGVVIIVIIGYLWWASSQSANTNSSSADLPQGADSNQIDNVLGDGSPSGTIGPATTGSAGQPADSGQSSGAVKEFTMTSFYEMVDGAPKPQFSLKEIVVKKGDRVKITITNTRGSHDFKIDELNVSAATPLNQPVVVEFTADQVGEFIYYCAMMNHRELGQWGTLKVTQ